jgi:hypothetical protein
MNKLSIDQVDIEAICKKLNVGRYELIRTCTKVARIFEMTPHTALKFMLTFNSLDDLAKKVEDMQLAEEFKKV